MSHASAVTTDGWGGEGWGVLVGCAASVLRGEMPICCAFGHRHHCRRSFVSCFQWIVNEQRLLYYKGMTADWYRFWYRLQYQRYRYQTDTTGIGPIPIPSTGIGLSLMSYIGCIGCRSWFGYSVVLCNPVWCKARVCHRGIEHGQTLPGDDCCIFSDSMHWVGCNEVI